MPAILLSHSSLHQSNHCFFLNNSRTSCLFPLNVPSKLCFATKNDNGSVKDCSFCLRATDKMSAICRDKGTENPIIVLDNYDSFTYNLCQYMGELDYSFEVYRNDEISIEALKRKNPRAVVISPGPGVPQDSGISLQTVLEIGTTVPLLGVCMGFQCIGQAFGGTITRSQHGVVHGKSSVVYYDEKDEDGLFSGLSNPFIAARYHSLVVTKEEFPSEELDITAWTEDGLIMAARHKNYKHIQGVQFQPESIITAEGKTIIQNFLKFVENGELISIST